MNGNTETERYDCISIIEYTETAALFGNDPGERVVISGLKQDLHKVDEDSGTFHMVGELIASIDLYKPLTDEEVTEWCNSEVGKHVLAHYFDHLDDPTEDNRRAASAVVGADE